jgi:hypothetical protein
MVACQGWKAEDGWRKEAHLTETEAHPAARVDGIVVESRGSRTHLNMPEIRLPGKSQIGQRNATVEVDGQRNGQDEAGQLRVGRENVNKSKSGMEPKQMSGKGGVRAAAIDTCSLRIAIDEPIQMGIQSGWIKYGRGA